MTETEVLTKLGQFKTALAHKNAQIEQLTSEKEALTAQIDELKQRVVTPSIENAINEIDSIIAG